MRKRETIKPRLVALCDIAEELGVSATLVRGLVRRGELEGLKVGRKIMFDRGALEEYLSRARIIPEGEKGDVLRNTSSS